VEPDEIFLALKARNVAGPLVITTVFERCVRISRLQRFQEFMEPLPGALPQAVTFRAFGAETQSFNTPSVAPDAKST
jgi:hypothetical protein